MRAIKEIDRVSFSQEEQYADEVYASMLTGDRLHAIVAEKAGAIEGYALLDVKAEPVRIRSLAVAPGYRDKGCGTALLRHIMQGHERLELLVQKNNLRAIRMYERLGFEYVERDAEGELAATHHMFRRFKNAP
ncbi:MAG TPA: GNAT family N-acetyltransferase [Candidatus Rubrimentiphilum sp.]|nr:GNAT family N-acetyltransferase [Candidatus Rubrimentiphilum sp.]